MEIDAPLLCSIDQNALDVVHVLDHSLHQIAGSERVEIIDRQSLQARKNITAQVVKHVLNELVVDAKAHALEPFAKEKRAE